MNETLLQGKFWLRPLGLLAGEAARMGVAAGMALPLAGGPQSFTHCEILARMPEGGVATALASIIELNRAACPRVESLLERLSKPRPDWAGRPLDRVSIMGIVNVTPDSFSDGGDFIDHDRAIAHGMALWSEGADLLDIGGESTRPGAMPVPEEEEIRRIEPVVRALAKAGAAVSIDTRRARVMEVAMAAGARVINDVSALADDPRSLATAAKAGAPLILMHRQGTSATMQRDPHYELASLDVLEALEARVEACAAAGIERDRILIDPGIGFGKHAAHNLEILARLGLLHGLGCGVMVGLSRKSLVGHLTQVVPPKERLPGSLAGGLFSVASGAQWLRVHDVAATRQVLLVWRAASFGA